MTSETVQAPADTDDQPECWDDPAHTADMSAYEDIVAVAWQRALRIRSIDRDADYRTLGMSSNRAMQAIREIYYETSIELPVNVFYEAPTIRRMAAAMQTDAGLVASELIMLRPGRQDAPLYLFGGSVGVMMELNDLVDALDYAGIVYGIPMSGLDGRTPILNTFEEEGARVFALIRRLQPNGPYRLAGYSVGGLVALEVARLLQCETSDKIFLGLLDTPQNDHAWPLPVWLRFIGRKMIATLRRKLSRRRRPPRSAAKTPTDRRDINPPRRGTQYEYRFRNPDKPDYPYCTPYWVAYHTPKYSAVAMAVCRMKGRYTPRPYTGELSFFASQSDDPLVCDPQEVWPRLLPRAEWIRMPGSHYTMMMGRHAVRLAAELSQRINRVAPVAPDP